jgi:hypothetical protein
MQSNKNRSGGGLVSGLISRGLGAIADHGMELLAILGFDALALWKKGWDVHVANVIMAFAIHYSGSDAVLRGGVPVKMLSMFLQTIIPTPSSIPKEKRAEYFTSVEDIFEEAGNKSDAFNKANDPAVNLAKANEIVERAKVDIKGALNMSATTTSPKEATKPPVLTLMAAYGELTEEQRTKFITIWGRVTNAITDLEQRNHFIGRARQTIVDPAELQLLLGLGSDDALQNQMLTQLVLHGRTNETTREKMKHQAEHFMHEVFGTGSADDAAKSVSKKLKAFNKDIDDKIAELEKLL